MGSAHIGVRIHSFMVKQLNHESDVCLFNEPTETEHSRIRAATGESNTVQAACVKFHA
jgi:hypothetical protein